MLNASVDLAMPPTAAAGLVAAAGSVRAALGKLITGLGRELNARYKSG